MNNKFLGTAANAHIVDLSHHNGIVDFNDLGKQGIVAVINKCCDGAFNADDRYTAHDQQARAAGLISGAYIFVHPFQDPVKQADKLCSTMATGTKVVALDMEWDIRGGIDAWSGIDLRPKSGTFGKKVMKPALDSAAARIDHYTKMLARIKSNLGFMAITYTQASFFNPTFGLGAKGGNGVMIADSPLWAVDVRPKNKEPEKPGAWKNVNWTFRQCGIGTVGKESPVDLDIFNGTAAELRARFA